MTKIAVCPKCKSEDIKVISPDDKITFMCENCGFKKKLGNSEMAKRLSDTQMIYTQCLSHFVVYGSQPSLEDIKKFKLEQFSNIMEEYNE